MNQEIETWKDVIGFEGLYKVSSMGNVKSMDRVIPHINNTTRVMHSKIMKQQRNKSGYLMVDLKPLGNERRKNSTVHRLVAIAFIPNPEKKKCVNHIDGNKANNVLSNLEWATTMENNIHAMTTGLTPDKRGSLHFAAQLTEAEVMAICFCIMSGKSVEAISEMFCISSGCIYKIKSRQSWRHVTDGFISLWKNNIDSIRPIILDAIK